MKTMAMCFALALFFALPLNSFAQDRAVSMGTGDAMNVKVATTVPVNQTYSILDQQYYGNQFLTGSWVTAPQTKADVLKSRLDVGNVFMENINICPAGQTCCPPGKMCIKPECPGGICTQSTSQGIVIE